ncbi:MAG: hypothetical protein AAGF94_08545 [Pseudomonadota bacterium]
MGKVTIPKAQAITIEETPYLVAQRGADFIRAKKAGSGDVSIAGPSGLNQMIEDALQVLAESGKLKRSTRLYQAWEAYKNAFSKDASLSDSKTMEALDTFQKTASVYSSYVKLPHIACEATFYEAKEEVSIPIETADRINTMHGAPSYGALSALSSPKMTGYYEDLKTRETVASKTA